MRLQSWPSTEPTVESPAAATGIIIYGGPDTAEASGMIIHGSGLRPAQLVPALACLPAAFLSRAVRWSLKADRLGSFFSLPISIAFW